MENEKTEANNRKQKINPHGGNVGKKKTKSPSGNEKTDISNEEHRKNLAKFILETTAYEALFLDDKLPDIFDVVKTKSPISHLMFPMVTKAIKTGSRSERAYLGGVMLRSDYDFIYEIGPLLVDDYRDKPASNM